MLFPKEIWKDIDKIKDYQVSNLGRVIGLYTSSISLCCNGKQKTVGGFHWKYVE